MDSIICPHHPNWENGKRREVAPKRCACRKPGTLLLEQVSAEYGFSPEEADINRRFDQ